MCCTITVFFDSTDNPLLSNKVTVTVNVLDVNEFPPELTILFDTFVCENAKICQVIQTINAANKDLPAVGQKFFFESPREIRNMNFTVRDFGNTTGIVTKRVGFQRRVQE